MPKPLWPLTLLLFGCDPGEDEEVDDEDPVFELVDADDDGFLEDEDCDDNNPEVYPGAEELCNGLDDDCDEEIDEESVDRETFYADADGDGFGDANAPILACAQPPDAVTDATDCDDRNALVLPGGAELCDGLDNDCDATVDANVVPRDFATIQQAIDGVADGGEVCVAPGSYSESFDLDGRQLAMSGAPGAILDLSSGSFPRLPIQDAATDVHIRGFEVSGLNGLDPSADGVLLEQSAGSVTLSELRFVNNLMDNRNGNRTYTKRMLRLIGGTLVLKNLEVEDLNVVMVPDPGSEGSSVRAAGFIGIEAGDLTVDTLTVEGLLVTGHPDYVCEVVGPVLIGTGGSIQVRDLIVLAPNIDLNCLSSTVTGGTFAVRDVTIDIDGIAVVGGKQVARGAERADNLYALLLASATGPMRNVELSGMELVAEGPRRAWAASLVSVNDHRGGAISDVFVHNNRLEAAESLDSQIFDGVLGINGDGVTASRIDVRGNTLVSGGSLALGACVKFGSTGAGITVRNLVVAGNTAEAKSLLWGCVNTFGSSVRVENADIVGNSLVAASLRGVVYSGSSTVDLRNLQVVENTVSATTVEGSVWHNTSGSPTWVYNNVHNNQGSDSPFFGVDDPTGMNGNLSEAPGYVDQTGNNPMAWDLALTAGAPGKDAGDPAITDVDSTTSDMGAYGGPDAW